MRLEGITIADPHNHVQILVIEAPLVPLLFLLPAEDPQAPQFENVLFANITVTTPHLAAKSPIGAAHTGGPRANTGIFRRTFSSSSM